VAINGTEMFIFHWLNQNVCYNKFCHPFTKFELLGWRMEQFGTEICTTSFKATSFHQNMTGMPKWEDLFSFNKSAGVCN
jgi:hypothetical protein